MTEFVITDHREHVFEITINRPEKRNALSWDVMEQLGAAIDQATQTTGVRAVLLRGAGTGFSAGVDLAGFPALAEHFGPGWRENLLPVTQALQSVVNRYEQCPHPTIALLHGYVLGLGCELALGCDLRIAAEGTRIGLPETRVGLIPDVGGTTRLTRLVGTGRAKELILTGRIIDAAQAAEWGIVNHVVAADDLLSRGEALAAEIAQAAPAAVRLAKRVIDGLGDLDRGLQLEALAQAQLIQMEDFETGAQAMLMKQQPVWKGK